MNKIINGALQKISRYDEFPMINWSDTGKSLMNVNIIGTSYEREIFLYSKNYLFK